MGPRVGVGVSARSLVYSIFCVTFQGKIQPHCAHQMLSLLSIKEEMLRVCSFPVCQRICFLKWSTDTEHLFPSASATSQPDRRIRAEGLGGHQFPEGHRASCKQGSLCSCAKKRDSVVVFFLVKIRIYYSYYEPKAKCYLLLNVTDKMDSSVLCAHSSALRFISSARTGLLSEGSLSPQGWAGPASHSSV